MRKEALARAMVKAGRLEKAVEVARKNATDHPSEIPPLATLVEVLHAAGQEAEAQEHYRALLPLIRGAEADAPILVRIATIVEGWKARNVSLAVPEAPSESAARNRVDLETVGPLGWSPYPAEPIALPDTDSHTWTLAEHLHQGRHTIVLFYLGNKCAHCLQQLQLFADQYDALREAGTDIVAVSTDDLATTCSLKANAEGVKFPMPLLADPELAVFRAYRAFDDFENTPLHGTFLIDPNGGVRFHRIGPDPFLDVEFLKGEAQRVGRLTTP
jgi:peroxiredoxin